DEQLLAFSDQERVRLYDVASGQELAQWPADGIQSVFFHPDGTSLFTRCAQGLWQWPIQRQPDNDLVVGPPRALSRVGAGKAAIGARVEVIACGWSNHIQVLRSGTNSVRLARSDGADFVAVSADGHWVAAGYSMTPKVRLWNAQDGSIVRDIRVQFRAQVGFSPDSRWLVTGSADTYCFWDILTAAPGLRIP